MLRKLFASVGTGLMLAVTCLGVAEAASSKTTSSPQASPSSAWIACVDVETLGEGGWIYQYVVTNTCATPINITIEWFAWEDTPCHTLPAYGSETHTRVSPSFPSNILYC